ncbi:class I SAM-dependent methyltransferase [Nostoc sp. UHCC 0252]|uniref:class I SAM-dependent methyltransferase n=1 Tax=Nostoc sp. UHCC 0252 TaxID=3110241 RepID=UPI002B1FBAD7|nr:class I SAM-dependent methyltransferase [Nostoc sp. UHCC 0252]MEA5603239.1 class I SAM-dependent methyltransferase [Nostoc sp. UHCC 0252]
MTTTELISSKLRNQRISTISSKLTGEYTVVTDLVSYSQPDQVFPIHPEQQFFLDELIKEKITNARVLEIGLGSGVLSIGALKGGAIHVTALEINPRAKNYAGFNILANGLEGKIEIRDGNVNDLWKPVRGDRFDYIISNPPFEPTPQGMTHYLHSAAGIWGLDFVEGMFKELDNHLTAAGYAQIVTFAPGNAQEPFMLANMAQKYLKGETEIKVNPISIKFAYFVDRYVENGQATREQVEEMKKLAQENDVSHLYLCVLHYNSQGKRSLAMTEMTLAYESWLNPL